MKEHKEVIQCLVMRPLLLHLLVAEEGEVRRLVQVVLVLAEVIQAPHSLLTPVVQVTHQQPAQVKVITVEVDTQKMPLV
jgi:hypothetical protein